MSHVPTFADLEIRLFGHSDQGYPAELTLDSHIRHERGHLPAGFLPWTPTDDPAQDGAELFAWLTADPTIAAAWQDFRARRPQRRIRLVIDADAPELHALPWELLREERPNHTPVDIAAATGTPFSRYFSGTWQPGRPILDRPIRVLVAIASPTDLPSMGLVPFEIDTEWQIIDSAIQGLAVQAELLRQPTLSAIESALREADGIHILHVIAHGGFDPSGGEAALLLCDDDGNTHVVTDNQFAEMLARIMQDTEIDDQGRLRMVYLDSCDTATRDSANAFRGFAPTLVQAGVPAVLAMQDAIAVEVSQAHSQTFYARLLTHGLVDLACNEARATLLTKNLPGAAIPVLFMRLPGGMLFGSYGQMLGQESNLFWKSLLRNIKKGKCVPFLGSGAIQSLLPTTQDLAQALRQEYGYPFDDVPGLPQVAQFVSTTDETLLRDEINRFLCEGFVGKLGLTDVEVDLFSELSEIVLDSDWIERSQGLFETEIHQQLADLDLPLYLTTNYDNLLAQALAAKGRTVRQEIVPWQEAAREEEGRPQRLLKPAPSTAEPVVLHLFGTTEALSSMVVTEDDHLDYLARIARDHEYLLSVDVSKALAESTLLFLGYRLQDLDMKVIMRGLLTNLDLAKWPRLNVAVQLDEAYVDEDRVDEVTRYFQKYFAKAQIDVYWGSVSQFVTELHDKWLAATRRGGRRG